MLEFLKWVLMGLGFTIGVCGFIIGAVHAAAGAVMLFIALGCVLAVLGMDSST